MGKGRLRCWLAAVCVLALAGCGVQTTTPDSSTLSGDTTAPTVDTEALTDMAIGYSHEDTLNPFATKTEVNLQLATLLYDSLTVIDDQWQPRVSLAASVDNTDATHLVVKLRNSARFSDGSAVTVEDVATSFRRAKASANYKALLDNVASVTTSRRERTITFTLAEPDPQARACLSFPIVKAASLTDKDGKAPLGGGLYQLTEDEDGAWLTANPHNGTTPHFSRVRLRHLPNAQSLYYGLSSGEITYYYDDLDAGTVPRVTGANVAMDMNALVFLGIRSGHPALAQPAVRRALAAVLDRTALARTAYSGWATATAVPFHPAWKAMDAVDTNAPVRDLTGGVKALQEAGYGTDDNALVLELIYPTGQTARGTTAELIRSQCEGAGVTVNLIPLKYKEYKSRLKSGKYDLYLGEVRLTANMSLAPLLTGDASYGVDRKGATATAYTTYLAGDSSLEDFLKTFAEDTPFVPLFWRSGFAAYDRRLTNATPHGYDVYYGFAAWK